MRAIFMLLFSLSIFATALPQNIDVIPLPVEFREKEGCFVIKKNTTIVIEDDGDHELEGIVLVNDSSHTKPHIKTFLLSGDGVPAKAWKEIAISSKLAIAIQSTL